MKEFLDSLVSALTTMNAKIDSHERAIRALEAERVIFIVALLVTFSILAVTVVYTIARDWNRP